MRLALAALSLALVLAAPALARPNAARGKALAAEACAACHQISARQAVPAPVADTDTGDAVPAPSFPAIASKYRHEAAALKAFIRAPNHPMREQRFLARDLDDIAAYIRSLAR